MTARFGSKISFLSWKYPICFRCDAEGKVPEKFLEEGYITITLSSKQTHET